MHDAGVAVARARARDESSRVSGLRWVTAGTLHADVAVMRRSVLLVLSLVVPALAGCGGETREATFASHLVPCHGPFPMACRPYVDADGTPGLFYGSMHDHRFTWGREETLRYRVEEVDDPPADGSSNEYYLEEVLGQRQEEPGTRFTTSFPFRDLESWFTPAVDGVVQYLGTAVACEPALCEQLVALADQEYEVVFEHTGSTVVPLRAVEVAIMP